MGYDIGPRIGIQGEKEFSNHLKRINNSLREYGSEMNALTHKFSENANSQEALTAKTKVLQRQYETQKQKSELLESQYKKEIVKLKELAESYQKAKNENGEASAEAAKAEIAYNRQAESVSKLKVAMNETEGYMNKLENSIRANQTALDEMDAGMRDAATGVRNLGDEADETRDKLDEISENVSDGNLMQAAENLSGVGDKIISLGEKAVQSFQNVEDAVVKVNARFGETGDAARANEKLIKDVYESGLGDSLDSVANAVILVKDNLKGLNETDMNNVISQGLILEDTYGIDMAESVRGVNSLMNHFGMSAAEAMDLLVAGTQNGLDKTNELGDNLAEYSGKFAEAGYSAEEYFQVLQNGLDAGAYNLDKVNDAINEVTTRLGDGTIGEAIGSFSGRTQDLFEAWKTGGATQKEVIDSIVADISSCTNQQEALNLASTAFGTIAEDGGVKVVSALSSVGEGYKDVSGKAAEMQENTTTSSQQMEAAVRKIQDAFAPMGESIADIITSLAPAAEAVANTVGKFSELPQPLQIIILAVAGIVAGISKIAPVMAALKSLGIGSSLLTIGSTITGTLIPAIGGGLAAIAPVAAVIAGIIAVVIGVIAVIKNWGEITDWLGEHIGSGIESIKGFFGGLGDKIAETKDKAVGKVKEMKDDVVEKFRDMKKSASDRVQEMKDSTSEKMEAIRSTFKSKMDSAKDSVKSGIENIKEKFHNLKLKLPEIQIPKVKLPHFSVSGSFSINPPRIPSFSVKWYKKGGILSGAQIFGRMGDNLLGGGEAGKEAVLPLDSFYRRFEGIMDKVMGDSIPEYSSVIERKYVTNVNVYVGNEEFDSYIVETAEEGISRGQYSERKARGE